MPRLIPTSVRRAFATLPAMALIVSSLALAAPAAAAAPVPVDAPHTAGDPVFPHVGNGGYDALHYDVRLSWQPTGGTQAATIAGEITTATTTMTARALMPLRSFALDFEGMTVSEVTVNGHPAQFTREADPALVKHKLIVTPANPVDGEFTVEVTYHGIPTAHMGADGSAEGWNATRDGAIVLGQPVGMMTAFPHNNTPSDKATYLITVDVPRTGRSASGTDLPFVVAGSGELVSRTQLGPRTAWQWRQDRPMASAVALIAIGHFDLVESSIQLTDGRTIPSWSFIDSALSTAHKASVLRRIDDLQATTRNLESLFGPYPGNSTGVLVDTVPPAMNYALETQDRSFFPSAASVSGSTFIHELAHQWFGNAVSPRTWSDIWIAEGLATWIPTHYNSAAGFGAAPDTEKTWYASWLTRSATNAVWRIPPGAQTDPAALFDYQSYTRAAQFWEALKIAIGDEAFFTVLREWPARNTGLSPAASELKQLIEEVSGFDITALWDDWILQPDKPAWPDRFSVALTHDATTKLSPGQEVRYTVSVTNTGPAPLSAAQITLRITDLLRHATLGPLPSGVTTDTAVLTWELPATAPGSQVELEFTATVSATSPGGPFAVSATPALGATCLTCTTEVQIQRVLAPSSPPKITGTPRVGETLTADPGTWPADATLSYSWSVDGAPLQGSRARAAEPDATLTIPAEAVGSRLTVTVTGSLDGWRAGSATSAPTAVVAAMPAEEDPGDGETDPNENGSAAPPEQPETGSQLPGTGGELSVSGIILAALLMTAGSLLVVLRRRRTRA